MRGRSKIELKTDAQFLIMAQAGQILADGLDALVAAAQPGVSTSELDAMFAEHLKQHNATSNFLGYYGYPATLCASVNDTVVHGIPNDTPLRAGDLLSIDAGAILTVQGKKWNSDSARSLIVGGEAAARNADDVEMLKLTEGGMWAGIAAMAKAGARNGRVGEIGDAIDDYVSERAGQKFGIIEDYTGHGIGTAMHMEPDVLNYRSRHRGPKLQRGMALAIEPILVGGTIATHTLDDDWTVKTDDGAWAAHWEHSVALHSKGIWVTTARDGGAEKLAEFGVVPTPIQD